VTPETRWIVVVALAFVGLAMLGLSIRMWRRDRYVSRHRRQGPGPKMPPPVPPQPDAWPNDLQRAFAEEMTDPAFRAAYERARQAHGDAAEAASPEPTGELTSPMWVTTYSTREAK
jgi:hypothetical protein